MKIAVTGAGGFIGRNVLSDLLRGGHSVLAVTRCGADAFPFSSDTAVEHVVADIGAINTDTLDRIAGADACIHLAWGTLNDFNSLTHIADEFPVQFRFLSGLLDRGMKRLVVSGTCLEYGLKSGLLSEETATDPVTPYGLAKDALRRSLEFHPAAQDGRLVWARLFYLYGDCPGRRTLFMMLKQAVERGDREFAMSAGEQLRDYLPVEEVAAQLVALSVAPSAHGIYNVCSGRPISVRRLVEQWIAEHGWPISPKLGAYHYPTYEPMAFWGDDRRIRGVMGE
jgi:dTDP-6-deoxy-L-talose 4-dehydrogenase (NAD+)